ncbi:chromate transporter [Deinococcus altitudinis]|uniref:chromate transporter n=1 Tax=Deinococcus altitudinis TaxID=468914 RepID=UPI00389267BB
MNEVLDVFLSFVRLGLLSFGSVNLAAMGQVVVEQQHWLTQERFVQGYALGQLLPGPNVLCIILYGYAGAGAWGGLAALLGFFLPPSTLVILAFAFTQRGSPLLTRLYRSLLPVGAGLLLAGLIVLGRGSVNGWASGLVAALSFLLARFTPLPPVLAVVLGLLVGAWLL